MLQEFIKAWLIPPALNGVLLIIGLLVLRWHKKVGRFLVMLSMVSLLLLSTDYIASELELSNQRYGVLNISELPDNQLLTIVVAGSSHNEIAREYGYSTPTAAALTRLHYASYLHRKTGYPVILTGGEMNRNQIHADVLARSFTDEFKTEAKWLETKSRSTAENAQYSAEILFPLGRHTIVLITHSYHMHRAVRSFSQAGFNVIPAPTINAGKLNIANWRHWVPNTSGLQRSANVLYEYLALIRDQMLHPYKTDTQGTVVAF